ncbi:MAG: hypothetical protein ACREQ5_38385, partial [Candidatus Dormibacteria bacterium]
MVGAAASGAVLAGNPVLVAGSDGTDARSIATDNTGQVKVLIEGGTGGTVTADIVGHAGGVLDAVVGAAIPANAVLIGGSEAGAIEPLLLDASGFLKVNVVAGSAGNAAASATGAAAPADADYLGASDGTNLQGLLVESSGSKNLRVAVYNGANEQPAGDAVGRAIYGLLTDGTNTAAVKAASTAPAATDPAVVAAISPNNPTYGTKAAGTAATQAELVGGVYSTTAPAPTTGQQVALQVDSAGSLLVNSAGNKATYAVATEILPTGAGNVVQIFGSATKVVKITRIFANIETSGTASQDSVKVQFWTTAGTTGTAVTQTALAYDSTFAAASAVVNTYVA